MMIRFLRGSSPESLPRQQAQASFINTRRSIQFGLVVGILMAVLGLLYSKTRAIDLEVQNRLVRDLRELRELHAEWNINIMKLRTGNGSNYELVLPPRNALQKLENDLLEAPQAIRGKQTQAALDRLKKTFSEKDQLVDQFMTENAKLRDALRSLPVVIEQFKTLLASIGANTPKSGRSLAQIDAKVTRLLADILSFNLVPDIELGTEIAAEIDDIENNGGIYSPALEQPLSQLVEHAQTVLLQRTSEDTLMIRIAAVATIDGMDQMSSALDQSFLEALNEKQRYRAYLFVYAGILLLLLAYAAWRLLRSYKLIARVGQRLQAANETLERRVAERTAELEKQSTQLAELALYDALTGLINRGQWMVRLNHALQRAERRNGIVVVMFIDLDGFKAVNDTYGHASGDLVLKEVATRVQRHLRQEDSLARLGGDEFVILLEDASTREGVTRVAQLALNEINGITKIAGQPVAISASIGISSMLVHLGATCSADGLLHQADQAMYQAKQDGKGCFRFSDSAQWRETAVGKSVTLKKAMC
jgi:diguanylate cyclase